MSGYGEEITIPSFYGKIDTEAYLDWEKRMEFIFGCKYYTEKNKVCLAVTGLCGSAFTWWQRVSQTRRLNRTPQVTSWVEMKTLMKKRFVSQWKLPELKPEAETKPIALDQFRCWSELPSKPAERRSVVPDLLLKQEGKKLQASILVSPLKQTEESHETEPEPTTLCLKPEEEAQVSEAEYSHVPDQTKQEEEVPGGSSKALELVLSTVEQGDSFKSLSCEFLIRPIVCLQLSLVEHLRVVKGLQQVVFEPGGSLCVFKQSHNILEQKSEAFNLDLQSSFTLEKQDLWSNLFEGREDGVILSICSKNRGETGGNTPLISPITDQNKLRRKLQKLVVVKEKPELENEYGDQTTRPPDKKKDKLRVHGLMFMCRTCVASSRREADSFKLNKVEESSTLEATCLEKSSKMLLRHEEGLQYFVFDPGEIREVIISPKARSCTLLLSDQSSIILQSLDLRTNPFKGGGDGVAMTRDIGELIESDESESDEEELIELDHQGDKGASKETDLQDGLELNLSRRDHSKEVANVWSGPITRSRLRAQEKSLQDLSKLASLASKREDQDKPACWFNLIAM